MATFMAMRLEVDEVQTAIWQKVAVGSQVIVTSQIVSYVDAQGNPITLPEIYEMTVVDGVEHALPGDV